MATERQSEGESEPTPTQEGAPRAQSAASDSPAALDPTFVEALRNAGLFGEVDGAGLAALAEGLEHLSPEAQRLSLLDRYYAAEGDERSAARRRAADRYFAHHEGTSATASDVVARLAHLTPELGGVKLERIGDEHGPLVLRVGEHLSAVVDERESERDGRSDGDASARREAYPTVSVHSLVRAFNGLLSHYEIQWRFVQLRSDGEREAYVAATLAEATPLLQAGYLEDRDAEQLMEFTGW